MYALLSLCGIFAVGILACRKVKRAGLDDASMIALLLVAALGVVAGGHLLYGLLHVRLLPRLFDAESAAVFFMRLSAVFGGQVFYGGLAGGLFAGTLYGRREFRQDMAFVCDVMAPLIPLFHVFGRLGCFAAGCCYGVESRFGFTFTAALAPGANGVKRLPVQLLEACFNLALFAALSFLEKHSAGKRAVCPPRNSPAASAQRRLFVPHGKRIYLYLLFYAAGRFVLELFRGDAYRGYWGPFSTSQWISLFAAGFAVFRLARPGRAVAGIVLLGPKHSGKTSAGAALAGLLDWPFHDLDRRIEDMTGKSPRALYSDGVEVFRAAETSALKSLLGQNPGNGGVPAVLAAGGGLADNPQALALLESAAGIRLVSLETGAETAWQRITRDPSGLPPFLLGTGGTGAENNNGGNSPEAGTPEVIHRRLHERRTAAYKNRAGSSVRAEGKTPETIAREIAGRIFWL